MKLLPCQTLLVVIAALFVAALPGLEPWLIYDRQAILSGEIWRLFTSHWVHLSARHLALDVISFAIVGGIIETRGLPRFGALILVAPWAMGVAMLVFDPAMAFCAGLSGLAIAATVFLALSGLGDRSLWSWACYLTLGAVAIKIAGQIAVGHPAFASIQGSPVVVAATTHLAGAVTALCFHICFARKNCLNPLTGRDVKELIIPSP